MLPSPRRRSIVSVSAISRDWWIRCSARLLPGYAGARPILTGWSEIGTRVLEPQTLGQGLGLPSSETVTHPHGRARLRRYRDPRGRRSARRPRCGYPQDRVRGGHGLWWHTSLTDPFGNAAAAVTGSDDVLLFGRVKATLEPGVIPIGTGTIPAAAGFEFPLDRPPLIALLTFEILNADIAEPPHLSVNGMDAGDVNLM